MIPLQLHYISLPINPIYNLPILCATHAYHINKHIRTHLAISDSDWYSCAISLMRHVRKVPALPQWLYVYIIYNPTIMQGFSVCLFTNSSFSSHMIDVKLSNPSQRHPWSVPSWLVFRFRSYFQNLNRTVLSGCIYTWNVYVQYGS